MHWYTVAILCSLLMSFFGMVVYLYYSRKKIIAEEPLITNLMEYVPPNAL